MSPGRGAPPAADDRGHDKITGQEIDKVRVPAPSTFCPYSCGRDRCPWRCAVPVDKVVTEIVVELMAVTP